MNHESAAFYSIEQMRPDLWEKCVSVVGGINESQHLNFSAIWWGPPNFMSQIYLINESRDLLKLYNKAWLPGTRLKAAIRVTAVLMATQILNAGLFGWDLVDPDACAVARRLLGTASDEARGQIIKILKIIDNDDLDDEWRSLVVTSLSPPFVQRTND